MRQTIFALMMAACAVAFADGGVRWLQTTYDFGAFHEDDAKAEATFQFVNDSSEPVTIISAKATCGCTVPKYSQDPVAPGDTAEVHAIYDPEGRPGRFEKQIYVRTSDSHERQKLIIKGIVIANEKTVGHFYPVDAGKLKLRNGLAMVGRVASDRTKSIFITGYNQSGDTIRPVFSQVPSYISMRCSPEAVAPGDLATVEIYFRANDCGQWGIVSDSIQIAANPGEENHWMQITAIVEEDFSNMTDKQIANAPALTLFADRVELAPVPLGSTKPIQYKFKFTNTGVDPLIIRRAYSQDPAVTVEVKKDTVKGSKDGEILVTFDPSSQPTGLINTKFVIISNDPRVPNRTIRIVGERTGE